MACISLNSIFDTTTKQRLVDLILSPEGDWESFLRETVPEKTDVLINKINKIINSPQYGGLKNLRQLDQDMDLDEEGFQAAVFYEIENNSDDVRRSEKEYDEKPDINLAFDPWDASGKTRVTKDFSHKLTTGILIDSKTENGKLIFFTPIFGTDSEKNTQINEFLTKYKRQLIQTIYSTCSIGDRVDWDVHITDNAFTQMIEDALTKFENWKASFTEGDKEAYREEFYKAQEQGKTTQYIDANDAYVKLKYFNYLVQDCGFVELKNAYKKTDVHGVNMYSYKTPKMNHVTRWGGEEIRAVDKHSSSAFKLLTNNIPSVDTNGNIIPGQYVGEDGFRALMSQFKLWLRTANDGNNIYDASLENGSLEGLQVAFNTFVDQNLTGKVQAKYKVRYPDRLRGIQIFFNSQMGEYAPLMWSYVLRSEAINYNLYTTTKGNLQKTSAQYRLTRIQSHRLFDAIKGSLYNQMYIYRNYNKSNDPQSLKNRYDITRLDEDTFLMFTGTDHEIKITLNGGGGNSREKRFSIEYIHPDSIGNPQKDKKYIDSDEGVNEEREEGTTIVKPNIAETNKAIIPFIEEHFGLIPNNWADFTSITSLANLYTPAIGMLVSALENPDNFEWDEYQSGNIKIFNPYKSGLVNSSVPLVDFLTAVKGSDLTVTLKDLNGNSIPAFGITSFQYNLAAHKNKIAEEARAKEKAGTGHKNVFLSNFVYENSESIGQEIIRNTVSINGTVKSSKELSSGEVSYLAVTADFGQSLYDENNEYIEFQNTTNSDKVTHPIIPYGKKIKLNAQGLTLENAAKNIILGGRNGNSAVDALIGKLWKCRSGEYKAIARTILSDYNKATDAAYPLDDEHLIESIDSLYAWLQMHPADINIRDMFHKHGVQFDENIHSDGTSINETLFAELRLYCGNNYSKFKENMQKHTIEFAQDLQNSGIVFNIQNKEVATLIKKLPNDGSDWVDLDTGDLILFKTLDSGKVEVNPILIAYNLCDALCSSEYNKMTFGMTFTHPGKMNPAPEEFEDYIVNGYPVYANKNGTVFYANDEGAYLDIKGNDITSDPKFETEYRRIQIPNEAYISKESSARLNASYKRTVIGGATLVPYLPQKYGVGKECVYAAVKDLKGIVWNMMGAENGKLDSMDGSMLASSIFSAMAQVSCTDAAVGEDSKTILGDLSSSYGKPILFKSAEYALTNNRRQIGYLADASVEALFEKMHSIPIDKVVKLENYYNYTLFNKKNNATPIYKKNPFTGKHYKISDFKTEVITDTNGKNVAKLTYKLTEVRDDGASVPNSTVSESRLIRTVYDIDQVFGGAYSEKLVDKQFEFANYNVTYATKVVCEEDLKMKFISYLVNTSAEKVGACNVNSAALFDRNFARLADGTIDSSKILTSKVSTMGLGVQMDPNHELDFSEVTEMSQMISSLIQGGHFTKLVNMIYTEIGKIAAESLKRVEGALDAGDDEEVYKILGESLMKSFEEGNKSTIGLAQSFIMRARIALKNKNSNYKIPFSAPTINGSFIADVASRLNSSGIRRKYAGIAAVLVPSHNMIQYYNFNGKRLLFNEFISEFTKAYIRPSELEGMTPSEQEKYIKGKYEEWSDEGLIKNDPNLIEEETLLTSNPTLVPINKSEINVEDTIVLVDKDDLNNRKIIKIDSFTNLDTILSKTNLNDYYCFNWTIKPKNLRQSDTRMTVDGVEYSIYEWDSVRASHYITHLKPGQSLLNLDVEEAFIIQREISKIISKLSDNKKALYGLYNISTIGVDEVLSVDQLKLFKRLIDEDTNDQLQRLDANGTIDHQYGWDINSPKMLTDSNNRFLNNSGTYNQETEKMSLQCTNVKTRFAEMMMGRLMAQQFGLRKGDSISEILKQGDTFFYRRLVSRLSIESLGSPGSDKQNLYDYSVLTKTGDVIYVSARNLHKDGLSSYKLDNKICTMDSNGIWINKDVKICEPIENAKIKTIRNIKGESCPLLIVDSIDDLDDLFESDTVSIVKTNVNTNNLEEMFKRRFPQITRGKDVTLESFESGIELEIKLKMITNSKAPERQQIIDLLNEQLEDDINDKYLRLASQQFLAFKQQLYYIGARIPTQSMQSFQALECIGFTEDSTGKVYVPKVQTWLQGSDYDIDKLYIMSFAISDDGTMPMFSNLPNKTLITNLTEVMSLASPNGVRYSELPMLDLWTITQTPVELVSGTKVITGLNSITNNQQWFLSPSKTRIEYDANKKTYYLYGITAQNQKQAINDISAVLFELNPTGISNLNIEIGVGDPAANLNNFVTRLKTQLPKLPYVTPKDIQDVLTTQTSFEKFNDIMESEFDKIKFDPSISDADKKLFLEWLNIHTRGEYMFYEAEDSDSIERITIPESDAKLIADGDYRTIKKYASNRTKAVYVVKSDQYTTDSVLLRLNAFQRSKHLKVNNREAALQNCNTARMLKLLGKATVQPYGHDPISLDELGDIAKLHTSSIEKRTTMDNAFTKFMMQFQNMVGKDVVGIAAVGMKVFFATSDFINTEVDNVVKSFGEFDDEAVAKHLANILFADTSTGRPQISTLANINLQPLLDLVKKGDIIVDLSSVWNTLSKNLQDALAPFGSDQLHLKELLESEDGLAAQASKANAAMNISQFLSAATDNAKELILSKINGGVEFADMWTYLMMTGHTLKECADIMTSPFFECVARLSQSNEFDNVSAGVTSKEILKMVAGKGELHTINGGIFKYMQRGFASLNLNQCFFLKLLYKTDSRGRFISKKVDEKGKPILIQFNGTTEENLKKLAEEGVELNYKVEFKRNTEGILSSQTVDKTYIEAILKNQSDMLKMDSAFWLTSPLACEIFIKHLRGQLSERSISELYQSYRRANGNYDDDEDIFGEEFDYGSDPNMDNDDFGYEVGDEFADDEEMESRPEYNEAEVNWDNRDADIRNLIRYVQRYALPRAELYSYMSQGSFDILQKVIEDIVPATEEQSIVGAILSINQGMKTNLFDFYNKLMRIENFVNRRLNSISENEETFDIVQFLRDPEYAKKFIDLYEGIKKFANPLAIINTVPNFKKMFAIQGDALSLFERSVQAKLDWNISREIIRDSEGKKDLTKKLTQPLFSAMHNGIRDSLIMSWLSTLQLSINIPAGGFIYLHNDRGDIGKYQVPVGMSVPVQLMSSETLATFKSLMDKFVFPAIKQMYPDNAFARSLQTTPVKDKLHNTLVVRQRLGINISDSDSSVEATSEYNAIQGDFMKIYNDTKLAEDLGIGNMPIGDMLYLYNLIVYKDSFGQDSFTRLFERTNVYNPNSLVNRYYEYLSSVDDKALHANIRYDSKTDEYKLIGQDGRLIPVTIKKGDLLARMAVTKDAKQILGIEAVYDDQIGSYEAFRYLNKYGKVDEEKEPVVVHNANPNDFTMELPFTADNITIDRKAGLDAKVNLAEYVLPSSRTTMTSIYNSIFDLCGLDPNNGESRVWSGNSKELQEKLKEEGIDLSNTREVSRILAAKGFIAKGKIYLNESAIYNGDDPVLFHELAHVICAAIKFSSDRSTARAIYYKMVNSTFNRLMEEIGIPGLIKKAANLGFKNPEKAIYFSDFKEEIFVDEISRALKLGIEQTVFYGTGKEISEAELTQEVKDAIKKLLHIDSNEEIKNPLEEVGNSTPDVCLAVLGKYLKPGVLSNDFVGKVILSGQHKALKQALLDSSDKDFGIDVKCK